MDKISVKEILDEAREAEQVKIPDEIWNCLSGFDVARMRMLTFKNMVALAFAAAEKPERFKVFLMAYLNPELTQREIADFMGIPVSKAQAWLKVPLITTDDYWFAVPEKQRSK